jgi:integrase
VTLALGKYVTLRPRKDGTYRVFFQVPARLRPSGWLSLIPLPLDGARNGDLSDLGEVGRIQGDAAGLYSRLKQDRAAPLPSRRDMPTLNRLWQSSTPFKQKKPRTQQGYAYHAGLIEDWSASVNHPPVASMGRERIEKYLTTFDNRPTTRRHVKIVLKMLLDHAEAMGWIDKNPAAKIKMAAPKTTVAIWEPADVEFYAFAAAAAGQPGLAALILTEWEIGQRLTDVRLFRFTRDWKAGTKAAEYDAKAGVFRFWQAKTQQYVTIPVSDRLRAILTTCESDSSFYLFRDFATGKPFAEQRLAHVFEAIRDLAISLDVGRHLVIRALRHSCVVQLARAECTIPQIASITGHAAGSVQQIISTYLPRDNQIAWDAQAKRRLILDSQRDAARNG